MSIRIEKDTMGPVEVPASAYWGAQTQRSINNFKIGGEKNRMPIEIIHAFAVLKKAAALTNAELGVLEPEKAEIIAQVCDEVLTGQHDSQFPLVVWQTGSGTQSNMNANEVIAYRAHVLLGGSLEDAKKKKSTPTTTSTSLSPPTTPTPRPCTLLPTRWLPKRLSPG